MTTFKERHTQKNGFNDNRSHIHETKQKKTTTVTITKSKVLETRVVFSILGLVSKFIFKKHILNSKKLEIISCEDDDITHIDKLFLFKEKKMNLKKVERKMLGPKKNPTPGYD